MNRPYEILQLLLRQETPVTFEALANQFHVSGATIRNDVAALSELLAPLHLSLEKKRGIGIRLQLSVQERSSLLAALPSLFAKQTNGRQELTRRKRDILFTLLNSSDAYLSIPRLADLHHISRATLQAALSEIKRELPQGLSLEQKKNKGIRISGEEKVLRSLYVSLLRHEGVSEKLIHLLHIDPHPILHRLHQLEDHLFCHFTEESFQLIALHLIIALRRILDGNPIEWEGMENYDPKYTREREEADHLWDALEAHYGIQAGKGERYLLYLYVICGRVLLQEVQEEQDPTVFWIAKEIITLVENMKQTAIDSKRYLESLLIHLQPMINRLQNHVHIVNPMLEEIKREYAQAYGIAFMTNAIFERFCHTRLNEDEVGFIAIHIQLMLEDRCGYLRALIVCNSGIGASQLLSVRLKSRFPHLTIAAAQSFSEFQNTPPRDDIDFILSTMPIHSALPHLIVSPLLTQGDIAAIEGLMQNRCIKEQRLHELADTFLFLHLPLHSQQEVIEYAHARLVREENVTEQFGDAIREREGLSSTAIGNRTAIPHASFATVKRSALLVITLQQEILWGNEPCDLILFIALTKADSIRLKHPMRELFYQLYDEAIHQKIIRAEVKETVSALLKL